MPDFDLDSALLRPAETVTCQHCGRACYFFEWDEDASGDWRVMHVTGKCPDCRRKTWFRYVYIGDKRQMDDATGCSHEDPIMSTECPFCQATLDYNWDLRNTMHLQLAIIGGVAEVTERIYFEANCPDCYHVRVYYQFDRRWENDPEDDWDDVEPDIDRRVLAPEGEVPEGD